MPIITLPDGSKREFDSPITGFDLAASIGPGLAKAAVAMTVNGEQRDLSRTIASDSTVALLTLKDEQGVEIMRHTTTAQTLARAVKALYPTAKLAIGPTVDHGFYYDIDFEEPISSDDLPKIEKKMREIIAEDNPVQRELWNAGEVKKYFEDKGETYKADIVQSAIEKGELIDGKDLSVYRQKLENGEDFVDLCRGPHVPSTGKISKAFTLTNLAGAYWRGDSDNAMLTRIYGLSFATEKELKAHQHMLEEAAKRDHRKIGPALDWFHFEDSAPGQPFWHDKGWTVYNLLMDYMRQKIRARGYTEVNTPQMMDRQFWEYTGHWDKYQENMFVIEEDDGSTYALKPMSCPGGVQVYKSQKRSYRDLPMRVAEYGKVFRREASGARHGLMRVQGFTQDDAHIFCTAEQLEDEVVDMCDLISEVYSELGFTKVVVKFSTRPEQRIGSDEDWDKAEAILQQVCERVGFDWELNEGDGAFYAPKLDFVMTDAIGREWQCGTIQVDLNLPDRLDIEYMGSDGERHHPYMVHRAILGSVERFMGILIENYAGHMPLWLSPTQICVMGISEKHNDAAVALEGRLRAEGFRVESDLRNEKVSYKVREHSHQKTPVILVLGDREIENDQVTVRRLGSQKQTTFSTADLINSLKEEVANKQLPLVNEEKSAA